MHWMSEALTTVIQAAATRAMTRPRRFAYGYHDLHTDSNLNYQLNRFLGELPAEHVAQIAARIENLADWKREMLT